MNTSLTTSKTTDPLVYSVASRDVHSVCIGSPAIIFNDSSPVISNPTAITTDEDILQGFFEHEPDFYLNACFFGGDEIEKLAKYQNIVRQRVNDFKISSEKISRGAEPNFTLRFVAPAHCGFLECVGSVKCSENSFTEWRMAAQDLLNNLRDMHCLAQLAFPTLMDDQPVGEPIHF